MRKILLSIILLAAFALPSDARNLKRKILTITSGTNTGATLTDSFSDRGYIEEIRIDVVTAGATGSMSVAINPELSTMADIPLVDMTSFAADAIYKPARYLTDTAGTEFTNQPPVRYSFCGDEILMTITNASDSNLTFKVVILYSEN